MSSRHAFFLFLLIITPSTARADEPTPAVDPFRVFTEKQPPKDYRLVKPKTLNDYFPFTPPTAEIARGWEDHAIRMRIQIAVATGLWPPPEKTPLNPVIHGRIDRGDYTIDKVYFQSVPGHYVSGCLYRPKKVTGKLAGVLCPHGHWTNGRFQDAGEAAAKKVVEQGGDKYIEGARFPLQASCAKLARMNCVVFQYDMIGYADSTMIPHRQGFTDAEAELRLQSFLGLQTLNSVRALDFLLEQPDVDRGRIGVTGASGGATQTFILAAVDDRPRVIVPAVMVSTGMQGGCVCENCSLLRVRTGNVEIAGLFAPKPLAMTGANDWTRDIETKGYPELRELYRQLGRQENVYAKCFPQFEHNFNQVSRTVMYNWFNIHLELKQPHPVVEQPFEPVDPKNLSVFDAAHPLPKDAGDAVAVRKSLTAESDRLLASIRPTTLRKFEYWRGMVGLGLKAMIQDEFFQPKAVDAEGVGAAEHRDGVQVRRLILGRTGENEQVPAVVLRALDWDGTVVVWIHPQGKRSLWQDGKLVPAARQIIGKKAAILAPDVFGTGELTTIQPVVDPRYAGFTFGYNRTRLAQRIHDVVTAVAAARTHEKAQTVHLIGFEEAGPWVLLARALCEKSVARTAVDAHRFSFTSVSTTSDEMLLPGALKYGDLLALAALSAPHDQFIANLPTGAGRDILRDAYQAHEDGLKHLRLQDGPAAAGELVEYLFAEGK